MASGRLTGIVACDQVDPAEIGLLMAGSESAAPIPTGSLP
jgi:hypothetical protein